MIKSLSSTELSSTKTRAGLASISDLLPRLIRSYELQAELIQRRAEVAQAKLIPTVGLPDATTQATFAWYD